MLQRGKSTLLTLVSSIYATSAVVLTGNDTCEDVGLVKHFDWDRLMSNLSIVPEMSYTMGIDSANLALVLDVDLEYLGLSYAEDHTYGYGVTYVLDFEDFDAEADAIDEPGNCQNRLAASFAGASWSETWGYSDTPFKNGHIDSDDYLSYPTSGDVWDLSIDNVTDICTPVHYHAEIGWNTLRDCANYDSSLTYTNIVQDSSWINLTGVFYINVVSPLSKTSDVGFYRVYQILSAPFVIAVRNQINLISSVGINLFTLTIIAVYKEDLESDFRLIVLTEAADFLMLHQPQLLTAPSLAGLGSTFMARNYSLHDGCLTVQSNLCSQLWEIYADDVECPPTDFTGTYGLSFKTTCNEAANYSNGTALCNSYIDTYGSDVSLTAPLEWLDEICDPEVFTIEFGGTVRFCNDSTFEHELADDDQYTVGEDRAFVEVVVNIPSNLYDIFEVSLDNVWICTTDPDNEPLVVTNQNLGEGGCLSAGSIIDSGFPYHLVISGVDNDLTEAGDVVLYEPFENATIRFSFDIDSSITRTNLYVQVQVGIGLVAATTTLAPGPGRRLLQAGDAVADQTRHFDASTSLGAPSPAIDDDDDVTDEDEDVRDRTGNDDEDPDDTTFVTIAAGAGVGSLLCCGALLFAVWMKKKGNKKVDLDFAKNVYANESKVVEMVANSTPTTTNGTPTGTSMSTNPSQESASAASEASGNGDHEVEIVFDDAPR